MNYWRLKKIANGAQLSCEDRCQIIAEVYCKYDISISDSFELIKVGRHLCDTELPDLFIQGDCAFFCVKTSIDERNYTRCRFYVRHDLFLLVQPILEQRVRPLETLYTIKRYLLDAFMEKYYNEAKAQGCSSAKFKRLRPRLPYPCVRMSEAKRCVTGFMADLLLEKSKTIQKHGKH